MKDVLTKPEINFLLSILVPLIALGVSWGIMTTRLNHVEALAVGLQNQYGAQMKTNEEIKVKLAEIQSTQINLQKDILYIRTGLDKHIGN